NRFCTLMGSIPELDNFSPSDARVGYLRDPNIFDFLTANHVSWAYYEQDIAFLRVYDRYRLDDQNILPFSKKDDVKNEYTDNEVFFSRVANGNLPSVTFIDPNYVDIPPEITANDDHPPADVSSGQELVRQIYNALVKSPQWGKTLFVITYDEHGGFYDHVPPPGTKESPEGENTFPKIHPDGSEFLGVRVPAIVISPWVDAVENSTIFDHTSIMKTILMKFGQSTQGTVATDNSFVADFGDRVRQANHLGALLTRDTPRLQVPIIDSIIFPPPSFLLQDIKESSGADFHDVMASFALPKQ
ncbi:MAG: alkaline phosphatase family protein, partial [Candidatus Promineifilaceae bacterium]